MSIALFSPISGAPSNYIVGIAAGLLGPEPGGGAALASGSAIEQGTTAGWAEWLEPERIDHAAAEVRSFGYDWYDRLHITPVLIELGNVIGQQVRELRIWNAYRRVQPMAQINTIGTEGITLTGQPSPPLDWEPLQERIYTVTISTNGPATINASYTFNFEPYDLTLTITGSRITPWTFVPDWTSRIMERIEFATDVIVHYDGSEQRRSVRLGPRKRYEFDALFKGKDRRYAESVIWGWGARNWALPIWMDGLDLGYELPAGATAITVNTETRSYAIGGFAILLKDPYTYEIVEISDVQPTQILITRETNLTWPADTTIYPARLARLDERVSLPRWDGQTSYMRAIFRMEGSIDYPADAGAATYRSQPVLEDKPNWVGGFDIEMERKLATLENITGMRAYDDESGVPFTKQRQRWTFTDRNQQEAYRKMIYALKGRAGAIWVPTWEDDFKPVATIGIASQIIDIEWSGYTLQVNGAVGRRDIRIQLTDGTIYYRRIESASEVDATTERIGIDAPLGREVPPDEVAQICFMTLSRLDTDTIELSHWTGDVSESTTTFKGFKNDV